MPLGADVRDFLHWWRQELHQLLPSWICARIASPRLPDWVFHVSRDDIRVDRPGGEEILSFSTDDMESLAADIEALLPVPRCQVEIRLTPGRYLERKLAPFRLPRQRARDMARLDIASSTPLDAGAVAIFFPADTTDDRDSRCFVVKKQTLQPLLSEIAQRSMQVAALKVITNDREIPLDPADLRTLIGSQKSWSGRALFAASIMMIVGGMITYAHAGWRFNDALHRIDSTIEQLEADAKEVRALSDRTRNRIRQIEGVREQKRQAMPIVVLWEELTRLLPDSVWLTDLTVSENRLTLTGYSASAASLLPVLEVSPHFRNPTFTAPVVKVPGAEGERFTIETEIVR
ncbi:PilN domain-containing protein [Nitratireductor sp. ZSWI3]|uniref:PilN domain-containing protein n=1 Tax=Nitratireductor sp. ZSWI3 TaxID=2966359 RepID=UPI0021502B26|nr:PilN domain-containing protein [Nitratireductor sp. ZSWI3]MCR4265792.1 PilN domain-containing protein [Nitratireductor sp. ZSWI3]